MKPGWLFFYWGDLMNDYQKDLLIEYAFKHFGDDAELVLTNFSLTGPSGLRRMLGEIYPEYFCRAYLPDQFDREFGDYAIEWMNDCKAIIEAGQPTKVQGDMQKALYGPLACQHGQLVIKSVYIFFFYRQTKIQAAIF